MEFVNPSFLYGLSAIAIPVIIHLFNFRRFKKIYFSNVDFIKELKQETQRQSKLKHLLVLLLRILAIIFIVLIFAQPYIPLDENQIKVFEKNAVSIYIDNSYSMQAESDQGNLLDAAKSKALEIISIYKSSDVFQLLTNDFEGRHQRFVSKEEFIDLVDDVEISPVVKSFGDVLARQNDLFAMKSINIKTSYLISDMQQSLFAGINLYTDTLVNIFLIPVETLSSDNLYIDSCWFEAPVRHINQNVKLNVIVKNSSSNDYEKIPIILKINDQQKALASFDIQANSEAHITLLFTNHEIGIQQGILEIVDYPISFDDQFYFSYYVSSSIPVLSINEEKENIFLNSLFRDDSIIDFRNIDIGMVDYSSLSEYRLIILNELKAISSGLQQSIINCVTNGGNLLIIPGGDIELDSYNHMLSRFRAGSFVGIDSSSNKISNINLEHFIYQNVFEEIPENVDLPAVSKYYRIKVESKSLHEKLLELQTNDLFLISTAFEKGIVYQLSVPLRTDFSNFPQHAIFVPTLYNMAILSSVKERLYYVIGENEVITLSNISFSGDKVFKIQNINHDFEFIPEHRKLNNYIELFTHDQIHKSGNYMVLSENDKIAGLSFNYDRTESEMVFLAIDEVKKLLVESRNPSLKILEKSNKPLMQTLNELNQGIRLWKWCLVLALLFLFAEGLVLRLWK